MNKYILVVAAALLVILQGCAVSQKETLNVYENNDVAFKASSTKNNDAILGWSEGTDSKFFGAIYLNGHFYNLKDVSEITTTPHDVIVRLKSGTIVNAEVKAGSAKYSSRYADHLPAYISPFLTICTKERQCNINRNYVNYSLSAIKESEIGAPIDLRTL